MEKVMIIQAVKNDGEIIGVRLTTAIRMPGWEITPGNAIMMPQYHKTMTLTESDTTIRALSNEWILRRGTNITKTGRESRE
jgi:hypothetical protein